MHWRMFSTILVSPHGRPAPRSPAHPSCGSHRVSAITKYPTHGRRPGPHTVQGVVQMTWLVLADIDMKKKTSTYVPQWGLLGMYPDRGLNPPLSVHRKVLHLRATQPGSVSPSLNGSSPLHTRGLGAKRVPTLLIAAPPSGDKVSKKYLKTTGREEGEAGALQLPKLRTEGKYNLCGPM